MSSNIKKDQMPWQLVAIIFCGLFLISPFGVILGYIIYICRNIFLVSESENINSLIYEKNKSVINLSGKTNLRQAMAILSLSESVFGSDTGLLHIAEALGKTANMILGPTSKETGGGVSLKISNNIETDIWCRPCSQNGKNLCYRSKQYCMDLISPSAVSNAVIKSL